MFIKLTRLNALDHSGVRWLQVIHLYGGSARRQSRIGYFGKHAVKGIAFYPRRIRGRRYRPIRQGFVVRALYVQSRFLYRFTDNTRYRATLNGGVLLKKRGVFRSPYRHTCLPRLVRRRRYQALFPGYV